MEHVNGIKAAVSAAVAALTALWGWFGWQVVGWVGFMVLDYITGTCAALKSGKWSSKLAREGIWHKMGSVCAVLASAGLDLVIGQVLAQAPAALPFAYTVLLSPFVVGWYILTEAGSVVENAGELGAPIPSWLRKAIAAFTDKLDQSMDEDGRKGR